MAQPTNDKINRNFRPVLPINLYVTNVDTNWTPLIKIEHPSGDKYEPDFVTMIDPYVKKMECAVSLLSRAKIIVCNIPFRDLPEMEYKKQLKLVCRIKLWIEQKKTHKIHKKLKIIY